MSVRSRLAPPLRRRTKRAIEKDQPRRLALWSRLAVAVDPGEIKSWNGRVRAHDRRRRWLDLERVGRHMIERWPDAASGHMAVAKAATQLGQFDEALAAADRALACSDIEEQGGVLFSNVLRTTALGRLHRWHETLAALDASPDLDQVEGGRWVRETRATVLCNLSRFHEAVAVFDDLDELRDASPATWTRLVLTRAMGAVQSGRPEDALADVELARSSSGFKSWRYEFIESLAFIAVGRLQEAEERALRCVGRADLDAALPLVVAGFLARTRGDDALASQCIDNAAAAGRPSAATTSNFESAWVLALIAAAQGRPEYAVALVSDVLDERAPTDNLLAAVIALSDGWPGGPPVGITELRRLVDL